MLWQPATVIAVEPDQVEVSLQPLQQCRACLEGRGCGAGVFSRLFPGQPTRLRLSVSVAFETGQRVRVGLAPSQLLRASFLLYGVPLGLFLIGALLGHAVFRQAGYADGMVLLTGLIAAASGLLWLRFKPWRGLNPVLEPLSCSEAGVAADEQPEA